MLQHIRSCGDMLWKEETITSCFVAKGDHLTAAKMDYFWTHSQRVQAQGSRSISVFRYL